MVFSFRVTVRFGDASCSHHSRMRFGASIRPPPFCSVQNFPRRYLLRILPEALFGSSASRNSTRRGTLIGEKSTAVIDQFVSAESNSRLPYEDRRATSSPHGGSGMPEDRSFEHAGCW